MTIILNILARHSFTERRTRIREGFAMTVRILALDIATKCGYALGDKTEGQWDLSSGSSGVWDLSTKKDESKGLRLIKLKARLNRQLPLDLVVFESVRCVRNIHSVITQSELQGLVKAWCLEHTIEYKGFTSSQIKKHATGKGNASKDAMVAAAKKKYPDMEIVDDNHADALWLLDLAITQFDPPLEDLR